MWDCEYDESGAIGKRYRRQDELGTPYCITIDFDTLENNTVTLRDRDSMQQERVAIEDLPKILAQKLR
jgi:glycyl-tRNA synthetase